MGKKKKLEKIITIINTELFTDYRCSQDALIRETFKDDLNGKAWDEQKERINWNCEKITEEGFTELTSASLNGEQYPLIAFSGYKDLKRTEDDKLIYRVIKNYEGEYYIDTGLYCGVINLGDELPQLEIKTDYSDLFFKRILNFCCGIYADTHTSENTAESESIYSLLAQYLFLISLRRVAAKAIPKKYVVLKNRGYDINGNINIEEYVNKDLISFDKKVTYQYQKRLEIQPIIDVLYIALQNCKLKKRKSILPNLMNFENYVRSLYSGVKPSQKMISTVHKEKCLNNSLYSDYKKPLEYARLLLSNKDLNSGDSKSLSGIGGFLVDASFLWEMYLYNLMRLNLENWDVEAQAEISFYEDTFFTKKNYPDFVLKNKKTGKIFVLDAKFKHMSYKGLDIDNEDIRQMHSYSYYYSLTEPDKFSGAALIYPTKDNRPAGTNTCDNMFGVKSAGNKFGVFTIKDPSGDETITNNEKSFIEELKKFLEE